MLRSYQSSIRCRGHQRLPLLYLRYYSSPSQSTSETLAKDIDKSQPIKPDKVPPLSPLKRPLGVMEPPTTVPKTAKEQLDDMMDQTKRMERRQHLLKEASKGYFHDLNATRYHGGKTWIAPSVLIREDKALYFPNIMGTALDGSSKKHTTHICTGRISVISMLSTKISEIHVAGFTAATHDRFIKHPLYTPVSINLQENLFKSFLVSVFAASIRRQVPIVQRANYLISKQNMEYVREDLGMVNKHVGYVYLLDELCRVRWAGCADAKKEEAKALENCVGVLLARLKKKPELALGANWRDVPPHPSDLNSDIGS